MNTGCSGSRAQASRRTGITVLEAVLALALISIVFMKIVTIVTSTARAAQRESAEILLEEQAQMLLERIARTIMGAYKESIQPGAEAPLADTAIQFQVHLGIENGEVIWDDPQRIALDEEESGVTWSRNPGTSEEQKAIWSRLVAEFLEGEIPDGMDNNNNGLIDERGLSFDLDGNAVTIRLTLLRTNSEGEQELKSVQTVIAVRNRPGGEV